MSEIINYTRLTTSDKLSDKFVTCQAYIPQDADQAERGQMFSHLEILSPWFSTSQVGQTIINTLIKEYYRGNDSSDLINFEESIKKVNESLAHTAQNGETEWIGKLSGVLVLVNKTEIHFAQTGKSHAYLYRDGKINHITEGLESGDPPHPLKTFSNLTSGTLQINDKIIIANDSFFEVINPTELKIIITSLAPSQGAIEAGRILQNHGTQDANAIFIELTNKEKLADLAPEQKLEAVYLDQQIMTLSALSKNALINFGQKFSKYFQRGAGKIADLTKNKIASLKKKKPEVYEEARRTKDIQEQSYTPPRSTSKSLITGCLKIKNKIRRFLIQVGVITRKRSKMYLILLIGVVVILAVTISLSLQSRKSAAQRAEAENSYNQIVALSGQADVLAGSNENDSLVKYLQVVNLSNSLKGTKFYDQGKPLASKAIQQIEMLAKLTKINPTEKNEIKGASLLTLNENKIFAISGKDLYAKKIGAGEFNKIASLGRDIQDITYITDLDLVAAISQNQLISFDQSGNNLKKYNPSFTKINNIGSFGANIYVSDTGDNQIYKIPYSEKTFQDKSPYLQATSSIANLKGIAIDGSIYTLSDSGQVTRYSRGNKLGDFKITLPGDEKIDSYFGLYTSENASSLLTLAKVKNDFRLIEMRKNGDFIKQYSLSEIDEIKNAEADQSLFKFYIISKDKIFEFSL